MTRRLIFCLITAIVSLAVCDGAFEAPSLTCARRVFEVRNSGPTKCTQLRWKQVWLKRPVFRQICGATTSTDEPLPYHRLRDDMARQSLDCGCEKAIEPKAWRRGAANKANGAFFPFRGNDMLILIHLSRQCLRRGPRPDDAP
jgi:hypothetical protein